MEYDPLEDAELLAKLAREAGLAAQKKAMEAMGHIVVAEDGWIVKKYKDGTIEHLSQIKNIKQ